MSVERVVRKDGSVVWRVRRNRLKVLGHKRDADAFDAEITRRKRTGERADGYTELDQYLMGVRRPEEVDPLFYVDDPRLADTDRSLPFARSFLAERPCRSAAAEGETTPTKTER